MTWATITVGQSDNVSVIALNRPDVMNALNAAMRDEITRAVIAASDTSRVIVLTGTGRAFCSGQDLGGFEDTSAIGVRAVLRDEYEPMLRAIMDAPVPVIAAVNGVAAGAGVNLALACDVVIAAESASFIQAFARIGLSPDAGGTWALPRQVGLARAMGAAIFADAVPARQAADWGMIWEAVADDAFDAHWRARAAQLAAGPTVAYRAIRRAMRASLDNDLNAQLALEADLQAGCAATADFAEGIAAFLARRKPVFRGR
jgi:2-(1,2-epoxy-1,2-dihydrophenyl)acetyl-CoA isomerase